MDFVILDVKLDSLTSYTGRFFNKEQWEQETTVILQFVSWSGYGSLQQQKKGSDNPKGPFSPVFLKHILTNKYKGQGNSAGWSQG